MDSLASLALATEPPKSELLDRPPYGRNEFIINRKMVKHMVCMSVYQTLVIYIITFAGEFIFPEPEVRFRYDRPDVPYLYPGRLYDWDGSRMWIRFES